MPRSCEFIGKSFPRPSVSFSFSFREGDLRFVPPLVANAEVASGGIIVRSRFEGEVPIFTPDVASGVPNREIERNTGVLPRLVIGWEMVANIGVYLSRKQLSTCWTSLYRSLPQPVHSHLSFTTASTNPSNELMVPVSSQFSIFSILRDYC
jgi:hypothetical protein